MINIKIMQWESYPNCPECANAFMVDNTIEYVCTRCGICITNQEVQESIPEKKRPTGSLKKSMDDIEKICTLSRLPYAVEILAKHIWAGVQEEFLVKSNNRFHFLLACIAVACNHTKCALHLSSFINDHKYSNAKMASLHKAIHSVCNAARYTWVEDIYSPFVFSLAESLPFPTDLHRKFFRQCCRRSLEKLETFSIKDNPNQFSSLCVNYLYSLLSGQEIENDIPDAVRTYLREIFYHTLGKYPFRKLKTSFEENRVLLIV
jgi:transcription initiation factor TFIIIB Brf1 subunit/transcription initiation factor TFIIB